VWTAKLGASREALSNISFGCLSAMGRELNYTDASRKSKFHVSVPTG
jgi:hypothetical protein